MHDNFVEDISILREVNFQKLQFLNFADNKIKDISVLYNVNFNDLTILELHLNYLSNINKDDEENKLKSKFKKLKKPKLSPNKND